MAQTEKKVKAKIFVQDFMSGMSRERLIEVHGLTPRSLEKLLKILVERGPDPGADRVALRR